MRGYDNPVLSQQPLAVEHIASLAVKGHHIHYAMLQEYIIQVFVGNFLEGKDIEYLKVDGMHQRLGTDKGLCLEEVQIMLKRILLHNIGQVFFGNTVNVLIILVNDKVSIPVSVVNQILKCNAGALLILGRILFVQNDEVVSFSAVPQQ